MIQWIVGALATGARPVDSTSIGHDVSMNSKEAVLESFDAFRGVLRQLRGWSWKFRAWSVGGGGVHTFSNSSVGLLHARHYSKLLNSTNACWSWKMRFPSMLWLSVGEMYYLSLQGHKRWTRPASAKRDVQERYS